MDIVRKKLSVAEVIPPGLRWDGTCNCVQTFDGTNWVDSPGSDPRYNSGNRFPARTGSNIQCNAAANMVDKLKNQVDAFIAVVDALATAVSWGASMALLTTPIDGGIGVLFDLLLTTAAALVGIGSAVVSSAMTPTVYQKLVCILFCRTSPDGSVNASQFVLVLSDVSTLIGGTAATVINYVLGTWGYVLLSNAGSTGTVVGSCGACASCGWVVEYDFTDGTMDGWLIYQPTPPGSVGGSYNGVAVVGSAAPTIVTTGLWRAMDAIHITGASWFGTAFTGTGLGHDSRIYDVTLVATTPTIVLSHNGTWSSVSPDAWRNVPQIIPFITTHGIFWQLKCDGNGTGTISIKKLRLAGTGTPPPGGVFVASLI